MVSTTPIRSMARFSHGAGRCSAGTLHAVVTAARDVARRGDRDGHAAPTGPTEPGRVELSSASRAFPGGAAAAGTEPGDGVDLRRHSGTPITGNVDRNGPGPTGPASEVDPTGAGRAGLAGYPRGGP